MNNILDFNGLKSTSLRNHLLDIFKKSSKEEITFYISDSDGIETLDRTIYTSNSFQNINNDITISKVKHSLDERNFIRSIFEKIDKIIDLDFIEMNHNNGSQIDIYHVNFSSVMQDNAVGTVIQQKNNAGSWWDIFWKKDQDMFSDSSKNTIVHEIGHALGLSHPFEDPFNKRWTTDDTVMSYNKGKITWNTWLTDIDLDALISTWGREDDNGVINLNKNLSEFKIKRSKDNEYLLKSNIGLERIEGIDKLIFKDRSLDFKEDIQNIFNSITKVDELTGKIFRLYNSAFRRFPDADGFNYWVERNQSEENSYRQTADSFIISNEFKNLYGAELNNSEYISKLYNNIFDRNPDYSGKEYWINQLSTKQETRGEVLMGFSESNEHKIIFSDNCGL